jgi:hypothetical protein
MFAMGVYLLHEATHKGMDTPRARLFWEGTGLKGKYHIVFFSNHARALHVLYYKKESQRSGYSFTEITTKSDQQKERKGLYNDLKRRQASKIVIKIKLN